MCGIVGIFHVSGDPVCVGVLKRMTDAIAHRGPDGEGHYISGPLGLGHRRLSIIDLSVAGSQPMQNRDASLVITYNGEVFNFQELRLTLQSRGYRFRSRTDTEVVLSAYEEWGHECVYKFNGMFAFGIWDSKRQKLFLARDRYGIKPLYWYFKNRTFIFASEIKAIIEHPGVSRNVCARALNEYFTFQNLLSDLTLFEGIHILPPGCILEFDSSVEGAQPTVSRYWDYEFSTSSDAMTESEACEEFYEIFASAVQRQLMSDVPVGAYLSGGMDSGSITAIASKQRGRLITFTGGFDLSSASGLELGFDERRAAEMLANLFKTEHYEVVLHAGDMEWVLPRLVWHLEDLRVGQSYPNFYVARLASKFVKVVLSGVGGDELFCGYPWRYYRGLDSVSRDQYLQRYFTFWQRLVPEADRSELFTQEVLHNASDYSAFEAFRSVFDTWRLPLKSNDDFVNAALYFELKTFLHGLLVVEDKLSMAHSLETRVPFLDNEVVDFSLRTPLRFKLANPRDVREFDENELAERRQHELQTAQGKTLLRKAMSRLIPAETTERVKQGFTAPDASWFRGESIDYINRLLRNPRARLYEFLTPDYVSRVLDDHCFGRANRRLLIWSFLSFEWWCRCFLENDLSFANANERAQYV